ncbi:hypothetical protein [Cellulomonas sp. S1-8]|uniref:hypothetical protein n=1 Tax=Cellulomonas sp. S1-8 TaxID=2904790 RepID=UPI002242D3A9|nr:hypothetical protein [Cellulomonas sp. S1-8]UZN01799.1 hypothetical protein OKX07_11905 [Cellulomonas sp. S1-8]
MSEIPGGPPPRDDDPSVPPPPPVFGQPGGTAPPAPQQPGAPTPPPGGAYSPPPAYGTPGGAAPGAYPPPASPYGQPGAQPPPGAYGPQSGPVDIGAGFSWAFSKFGQHWVAFVLGGLAWFAVIAVVAIVGIGLVGGVAALGGGSDGVAGAAAGVGASIGIGLYIAVMLLLLVLFSAAFIKAALKVAAGHQIGVGDLFDTSHMSQLVVLGLLYAVAGFVLNFIPFLGQVAFVAAGFFVFYAVAAIVDRNEGAIEAIRTSVALQTRDLGTGVLVYLLVAVVSWIGTAVCGIGVLVSLPVGALLTVYAYRRLTGGQVAA